MRYHIPLDGNPSTDVALRNKYIAAFGAACYMSEVNTFDCFYKKWQDACADAVKMAEVAGNAPYDKGHTCQPVAGTGDYTLQVGSDVANKLTINYQAAPRQTPLVEIDGVPTEVNGPYRNLSEPKTLGPGGRLLLLQRPSRRRWEASQAADLDPPGQQKRARRRASLRPRGLHVSLCG